MEIHIVTLDPDLTEEVTQHLMNLPPDAEPRECKPDRLDIALALLALNVPSQLLKAYLFKLANYYFKNPILRYDVEAGIDYSDLP